jgi:outer membrane autotransporter protein
LYETIQSDALKFSDLNSAVTTAATALETELGISTEEAYKIVLSQLDPVALSTGSVFTESAVSNFNRVSFDRVRMFNTTVGAGYRGQICDPCDQVAPCDPCGTGKRSATYWFQGMGTSVEQDDDLVAGYSTDGFGFALGAERQVGKRSMLGLGFGTMDFDTDMNNGSGNTQANAYLMSLYGGHTRGDWQFTGSLGYVLTDLESYWTIGTGDARSERDADTFFGSFEVARQFGSKRAYLTPFLGFDVVRYDEEAFQESGDSIAMGFNSRKVNATLQTLGARLGRTYTNRWGWVMNPQLTLGWIHDYEDGAITTTAQFNEGGSPFTLLGTARHQDRGLVGVNINAQVRRNLTIFGKYDGEFASGFNSHSFQAGAALQF